MTEVRCVCFNREELFGISCSKGCDGKGGVENREVWGIFYLGILGVTKVSR